MLVITAYLWSLMITMADYRYGKALETHSDDGSSGPEIVYGKQDHELEPYPSSSEATYESPKSTRSKDDFTLALGQHMKGINNLLKDA